MKEIIATIILVSVVVALIIGVVLPIMGGMKTTGQKTFDSVNQFNKNIVTSP